jgi:hypothetical protein
MGNIGYTGRVLSKQLDDETIKKGGLQQVNTPILNCKIASELETMTVEVGGYPTLVHYNKHREKQHKKLRQQKRERSLKRQIKRFSCCNTGEDFPSPDLTYLNKEGGSKS